MVLSMPSGYPRLVSGRQPSSKRQKNGVFPRRVGRFLCDGRCRSAERDVELRADGTDPLLDLAPDGSGGGAVLTGGSSSSSSCACRGGRATFLRVPWSRRHRQPE